VIPTENLVKRVLLVYTDLHRSTTGYLKENLEIQITTKLLAI